MTVLLLLAIVGVVVLIVSTDLFVTGASRVADGMHASPVLVGSIILGCGTGLPEFALALHSPEGSPWRDVLHFDAGDHGLGFALLILALVVIMTVPFVFPERINRHSPLVLATTITFAVLLRGSLDRVEAMAMLVGFALGVVWIVHTEKQAHYDPFGAAPRDNYGQTRVFHEPPVMTPVQLALTRSMIGLVGTAAGAQLLARSAYKGLESWGISEAIAGVIFVALGSLLPHLVVAVQAIKQHHEGLAIGNLIGSNFFQSLVIGGVLAIIRPYQAGGELSFAALGAMAATGALTWLLLHTQEELSARQGVYLLGAYVALVLVTVW